MGLQENLIDTFAEFKELKNIDRSTMIGVMKDVFSSTLVKLYGEDSKFNVIVNDKTGDLEIWRTRTVVEDDDYDEIEDKYTKIPLSEAQKIDEDYEVGEEYSDEIRLQDFGRRAILALKQNLQAKIMEREKDNIYLRYKDRIGELITAEVYQVWKREILVRDEEGTELLLSKQDQIPSDKYRKGDTLKAVISSVELKNGSPIIKISRTSEKFLERLFEQEIPEIGDSGLITIKKIVRIPGERAKVAVESYDERVDPVGACVGMKGSRIHGIVRELHNENIDIVNYTTNMPLYIQRILSPAKISSLKIINEEKRVEVYLNPDQVSLAIGKGGLNIKLACQLLGYTIDVFRVSQEEDIDLDEFNDEIEQWVIDQLKAVGCDTALSVLELSKDELVRRTDLEEETIDDVIRILKAEFNK
ncbi:MAG: transcription termination/antitermination protein NusA [Bacteroidales bacterium]|jgi:N utilization substance protein A|nr:transcription termination/antitermination protein NusA [Bacteroidales bacterium]MBQ1696216.1 transcription termination/antitermination protein NusA [Bacteroidales bacterium]MBQ1731213.1 transcription termination/antitermination protein NusA [Bacteroidales bacterium]MBQ2574483.1 transcription termination/antitermination protein NusA [Bacteroidales bacterium]MBQ3989574.1 transcription termination/antitermination protein NusA [Bacteroidales bacterium]